MNLVEAEVDGATARVAGQTIQLARRYPKPPAGSSVRLGFRPDYARLSSEGVLKVQVQKIDDLGRRRLARVKLGPHEIFATVPNDAPINDGMANLAIKPERLFVYVNDERVAGEPS
jgi:glycerol transport system ATP-binding protein